MAILWYKQWIRYEHPNESDTSPRSHANFDGWFLFGFIPLYVRQLERYHYFNEN